MRLSDESKPGRPRRGAQLLEIAWTGVQALVLFLVLSALVGRFEVHQISMEPTFHEGQRVLVSKLDSLWSNLVVGTAHAADSRHSSPFALQRGQVVVFYRTPARDEDALIKRVIGLPGDHVKCCDAQGRITVNGQPLDEGTYLYSENGQTVAPSEFPFDVVVPKDRIWVMGDHRNNSQDSRCHLTEGTRGIAAFVPTADVVGSAVAVVYPFDRWRTLSRPATFDQVPAATAPAPDTPVIVGDPPTC